MFEIYVSALAGTYPRAVAHIENSTGPIKFAFLNLWRYPQPGQAAFLMVRNARSFRSTCFHPDLSASDLVI
jgi:hypothetical protein